MKHLCLALAASVCLTSCAWQRIGSLTMISTRNVDTSRQYVPIARGVEGKSKGTHNDALQEAIDQAVQQHPTGEYMMNAVIYVRAGGKKVKVTGDVWGTK